MTEIVDEIGDKVPLEIYERRMMELVNKINTGHQEIERASNSIIEKACATGKLLIEAKRRIKHGGWQRWMANNLLFTERTAQKYMLIAEHENKWRGKTDSESDLTLQGLIDLVTELTNKKPKAEKPAATDKGTAADIFKAAEKAKVRAAKLRLE
jgi:DUF3102 family protein